MTSRKRRRKKKTLYTNKKEKKKTLFSIDSYFEAIVCVPTLYISFPCSMHVVATQSDSTRSSLRLLLGSRLSSLLVYNFHSFACAHCSDAIDRFSKPIHIGNQVFEFFGDVDWLLHLTFYHQRTCMIRFCLVIIGRFLVHSNVHKFRAEQ